MKRWIAAIAAMLVSANALAATATYTGQSESGWSATRLPVIMCEYEVEGRRVWKTFKSGRCPKTVEVEVTEKPKGEAEKRQAR